MKAKYFSAGLILALFIPACMVYGQEMTLSVEDAVNQALTQNTSLKSDEINLGKSKRSADNAGNVKFPSFRVSAGANGGLGNDLRTTTSIIDNEETKISDVKQNTSFSTSPSASISLSASASWTISPTAETSIKAAELNYQAQQLSFEKSKRNVEKSVRLAFYKMLYDQENINLKQNSLDAAKRQYESIEFQYERGAKSQLELLNSQLTCQTKELELNVAKSTWETDMASFKQTLGLDQNVNITLDGKLDDILEIDAITLEGIVSSSATIETLKKNLEIAENTLNSLNLAAKVPTWTFSVSDSLTPPSYSDTFTIPSTNTKTQNFNWLSNRLTLSASVSIPVDYYVKGSSTSVNIENQKDTIENLKLQIKAAEESLALNVNNSLVSIEQYKEQIAQLNKTIELAQKTYELTKDSYEHGLKNFNDLQDTADKVVSYRVNLMNYAYLMESSILNLEDILGIPFGTLGNK